MTVCRTYRGYSIFSLRLALLPRCSQLYGFQLSYPSFCRTGGGVIADAAVQATRIELAQK